MKVKVIGHEIPRCVIDVIDGGHEVPLKRIYFDHGNMVFVFKESLKRQLDLPMIAYQRFLLGTFEHWKKPVLVTTLKKGERLTIRWEISLGQFLAACEAMREYKNPSV